MSAFLWLLLCFIAGLVCGGAFDYRNETPKTRAKTPPWRNPAQ